MKIGNEPLELSGGFGVVVFWGNYSQELILDLQDVLTLRGLLLFSILK